MGRITSITASYLVLRRLGTKPEILMLQRSNTGYCDGQWSLPAGHLEANEAPAPCMARECAEEIGLALHPEDFQVIHTNWRSAADAEGGRVDFYLEPTVAVDETIITNKEPHKCSALAWFPTDSLPANTIHEVKHSLNSIFQGHSFSYIHN